jgi:ATP/maltotriose-dependent transcriptional regulator MalT
MLEYYRSRVHEVEELIADFERIGPGSIPASRWDAALADLAAYAEWAQQNVDTIESTSDTVSDMSPDSIWSFRGRLSGACGDVFDIN